MLGAPSKCHLGNPANKASSCVGALSLVGPEQSCSTPHILHPAPLLRLDHTVPEVRLYRRHGDDGMLQYDCSCARRQ
jgi:hypothetical protein